MKQEKVIVKQEQEGSRLDMALTVLFPQLSRSMAQRLIEEGLVLRAGKAMKKKDKLCAGDELEVTIPEPKPIEAKAEEIPLDIVYEDDDVIVINKPKGMVVHPAAGNYEGTLVNALLAHCGSSLSGIGGELRPGIVHRIDKDTSGLLIVAKNDEAHRKLSAQLADHTLHREYECIVLGALRLEEGTVNAPIGRSTKDRKKMAINPQGKQAVTHYKVLGRYPGYTHLQCILETGRTHQIRVHMASLGHPLAGDPVYGSKNDRSGIQGQCLHARRLIFIHPRSGEKMVLECPLPEDFTAFLEKLKRKGA
ncbi:RluA family pseudouridine synthase [Acidaminobacterium chupaoyuni]